MANRIQFIAVLFVLILAGGCGKKAAVEEPFVAKVGEARISPADFARELKKKSGPMTAEVRESTLQGMVRTEALLAGAKKDGFDRDADLQWRVKRLIASAYEEKLGGGEGTRTNSAAELEEYYAMHGGEFRVPERARAAMIFWRVPKKATEEKQKEFQTAAEGVLQQARQLPEGVAGFGDLARTHSEDQASRYAGGDLGWMTRAEAEGRLGKELAEELFKLKAPREMTATVKGAEGIYVFKLIGREEARSKRLEEVKDLVAYRVRQEEQARGQKALEEKIRSGLKIEIDRDLVEKTAPVTNSPPQPPRGPGG